MVVVTNNKCCFRKYKSHHITLEVVNHHKNLTNLCSSNDQNTNQIKITTRVYIHITFLQKSASLEEGQ